MRILHVSETYVRSGVGRVIDQIASVTPEHEHFLLWSNDTTSAPVVAPVFQGNQEMPDGLARRMVHTQRYIAKVRPITRPS